MVWARKKEYRLFNGVPKLLVWRQMNIFPNVLCVSSTSARTRRLLLFSFAICLSTFVSCRHFKTEKPAACILNWQDVIFVHTHTHVRIAHISLTHPLIPVESLSVKTREKKPKKNSAVEEETRISIVVSQCVRNAREYIKRHSQV